MEKAWARLEMSMFMCYFDKINARYFVECVGSHV
jgi:hypothetical protein